MTTTPILGLTELAIAQAVPEVTVNENTRWLEFFAAGGGILDRDENDPSGLTPSDGDAYLIDGTGADDWTGHDDEIALYISTAWEFKAPVEGMSLYVADEDVRIDYDGAAWNEVGGSGASTTQTAEMIAGFIAAPSDKSYTIAIKMAHGGTITETTTKSVSGTCTATFKVNSTALGGTANSVSSAEDSQAHASTNTFSAGDDIVLTVSSNSSCADMSFSIKYTRTLD